MDNTKYIALSRQMALWKQMDIVSNNMANVNTSGFKAEDALFTSYLTQTNNASKGFASEPVYFTQDFGSWTNFAEGSIMQTGNQLDAAILGDGYFAVATQDGERYTRKGQFAIDDDGKIVTSDGYAVLSENNAPFFIAPTEKDISISESGEVSTENGVIGKLKMVQFDNPQQLLKTAGVLFESTDAAKIKTADNARVLQGSVEKSNVNGVTEMTKLVQIQRSYEYVQQMIDEEHSRLSNTISAFTDLI